MTELAIIIPTFNERDNVLPLLDCLKTALDGVSYEVIFVDDDSPDDTASVVREIALNDTRVRILHRVHRRGLASACIEGMLASAAPYIAVMDADMQHDERILPEMLNTIKTKDLDMVVGSRNIEGGSMGEFSRPRVALSMLGRRFSQLVCGCEIKDPMSGFFILKRSFLMQVVHRTSGVGFKILVDLLASSERPVRLEESPYRFRKRLHGESKLDILVGVEYFQLLLDKTIGDFVPPTFVLFGLVGAVGIAVHLSVLSLLMFTMRENFGVAQVTATLIAMTVNFLLNNAITYRDRRLRGWGILRGLISFYIACAVGVLVNLKLAEAARTSGAPWYFAGIFGLGVGSVWNYGVTRIFTWRTNRRITRKRALARVKEVAVNQSASA